MKRILQGALILVCGIALNVIQSNVYGQYVKFTDNPLSFTVNNDNPDILTIKVVTSEVEAFDVKTKQGFFLQITVPGYGYTTETGKPQLPVLKKLIEVPWESVPEIIIEDINYQDVQLKELTPLHQLIPSQPPVSKETENPDDIPFIIDSKTYETNAFYSQPVVRVVDLGIMRGVRLARLEIAPFRYNPVTGTLQVITEITSDINFKNASHTTTEFQKARVFSPFYEAAFGELINHKTPEGRDLITIAPITYIIVSDPAFQAALQPFIQWKTKKGYKVVQAYTNNPSVGTTTTSIKNYLQGFYNNPPAGYHPQSFVLFVGDVAQIPAFTGTSGSHVTDLYYCEYTGDVLPEVYYGRFSANNLTELQPQIDKTLQYEQYLMPDPSFLDEVVMVAGADASHQLTWGNGQINYGTTYYFNGVHNLISHTYLQPLGAGAAAQIRQNVSDGVGYANYTAHCSVSGWADPSFSISDIANLQNANQYPLMVGNCCLSNSFQSTCFGEVLLRTANKGALGYIGGSNNTYWDEDYWWGVGFKAISANPVYNAQTLGAYDRTFHDRTGISTNDWFITQGQMVSAGNLAVSQSGSSRITYYWEIYHLMGDPSLMVYFAQPPDIVVSYDGLMPLATESFTINTDPFAYVAISKEGTLHGAVLADASGVAVVALDPITVPGTADVIVTKQNGKPFIGTVEVASPNGPYVLLDQVIIDDSNGNQNGLADYGEQIMLDVALKNLGSSAASQVIAVITTNDQYVSIISGQHEWALIPAGQTITGDNAFEIQLPQDIPDQHVINFNVIITSGTDNWNSTFNLIVQAPLLEIGTLTVDDTATGNGNSNLDAGETANLVILVKNTGHSQIQDVTSSLTENSIWVEILNATFNLGTLAPGETRNAIFPVMVDAGTPVGTVVTFQNSIASGNYTDQKDFGLTIGLVIESFETGNFSGFPWKNAGNANWIIDNQNHFEGLYAARSGVISHNQSTTLWISLEVIAAGNISFARKVSSESGYDYLRFYIDDIEKEKWAGTIDWAEVTYPVTAGTHTFKWEYKKDGSVSTGSDCGWIDKIIFPPVNTSPVFSITGISLNDTSTGNGNGILDPGESAFGNITFTNAGITTASEIEALLVTGSGYITLDPQNFYWENMVSGATLQAGFEITAASNVPPSTLADLHFMVVSGTVSAEKSFYLPVGFTNVEDFETGNFTRFPWQFTGNANWVIETSSPYQGSFCTRSGDINDGQTSGLQITVNPALQSEVSFYYKVSSEASYDYLKFYIDGVEKGRWAGTISAWTFATYPVAEGSHLLKWSFEKDGSVSGGSDCAWVDMITLPLTNAPTIPVASFIATNTSIDPGESIRFYDISTGIPTAYLWTFEGGSPPVSTDKNPLVTYTLPGTYDVTLQVSNAMGSDTRTEENYITVNGQTMVQPMAIPAGWSGISTCMIPQNTDLEILFQEIMDDIIIIQGLEGMFFPEQGINTIGTWDNHQGYKIKLSNTVNMEITGMADPDRSVQLVPGWNLIPVLSECDLDVAEFFSNISDQIVIVKEAAGTGIFWPSLNINTLVFLRPGKSYFILTYENIIIDFPACGGE